LPEIVYQMLFLIINMIDYFASSIIYFDPFYDENSIQILSGQCFYLRYFLLFSFKEIELYNCQNSHQVNKREEVDVFIG
jgi:hypothetical protein